MTAAMQTLLERMELLRLTVCRPPLTALRDAAYSALADAAAEIRRVEAELAEALGALEDLTRRCDGAEGVRADGSNIQTMRAGAVLANRLVECDCCGTMLPPSEVSFVHAPAAQCDTFACGNCRGPEHGEHLK